MSGAIKANASDALSDATAMQSRLTAAPSTLLFACYEINVRLSDKKRTAPIVKLPWGWIKRAGKCDGFKTTLGAKHATHDPKSECSFHSIRFLPRWDKKLPEPRAHRDKMAPEVDEEGPAMPDYGFRFVGNGCVDQK